MAENEETHPGESVPVDKSSPPPPHNPEPVTQELRPQSTSGAAPGVPPTSAISASSPSLLKDLPDLMKSVLSRDGPTQKMAIWFIFNLICLMIVMAILIARHVNSSRALKQEAQTKKAIAAQAERKKLEEKERYQSDTIVLGTFTIQLKSDLTVPKMGHVYNLAEIEVVALCCNQETKIFMQENAVPVKDAIAGVFTSMDRDELMSRKGKERLKVRILKKLNEWLKSGKVEAVYISKLIIT